MWLQFDPVYRSAANEDTSACRPIKSGHRIMRCPKREFSGDRLWHRSNLGKAAVEFGASFEIALTSARERLNYGLALLRGGKTNEGTT